MEGDDADSRLPATTCVLQRISRMRARVAASGTERGEENPDASPGISTETRTGEGS